MRFGGAVTRQLLAPQWQRETTDLLRRMSVPASGARVKLIDRFITQLKAAGIWQKLDVLWVMAAHDAQAARLNWIGNSTFDLTAVNTPTFTIDRGYAGNGTTSYLNTNFIPATHAVRATLNDASAGVYCNGGTDTANAGIRLMGVQSGTGITWIGPRNASDFIDYRVNGGAATTTTTSATRQGFTCINRTASNAEEALRNAVSLGTSTAASTALPITYAIYLCGNNANGTAGSFVDNTLAGAFHGASLSAAQHATFYVLIHNYMRNLGAQHT